MPGFDQPMEPGYAMRNIAADEQCLLGSVLGQAFADDPIARWSLKTPAAITATYTMLCQQVYFPRGTCILAKNQVGPLGGAMWLQPRGRKDIAIAAQLSHAATLFRESGGRSIAKALLVNCIMDRHRPDEDHFYLFALGVLPQGRGRGIAREMVTRMTDAADAQRLPCWLENSNPRNEALYRAMGFTPIETFAPAPGCPPMTTMLRHPC